jgi:Protein of unknown function (DUF2911)
MYTKKLNPRTILFLSLALASTSLWAQQDKSKRASPPDSAMGVIHGANIKVTYGSPSVKGRKVWGDLVPYNKAWRAGANEATVFQTDKVIKVNGKKLPAGKYSLFAIPGEKKWDIVLNSQTGQWGIKRGGDANYDSTNNVITVSVTTKASTSMNERLVYEVTKKALILKWENLEVPIPIK